ncbi:MAG: YgaP family membrane protein [Inquilinaceae bacterium]
MPRNEGAIDRVLRVIVGLAILSLVFVGPQTPWAWLGLVPLLTGLAGFCPAYAIFGLRTCPLSTAK